MGSAAFRRSPSPLTSTSLTIPIAPARLISPARSRSMSYRFRSRRANATRTPRIEPSGFQQRGHDPGRPRLGPELVEGTGANILIGPPAQEFGAVAEAP